MLRLQYWLRQEVAVSLKDLVDVSFEVLSERWGQLVEAADQSVTEARVRGAGTGVESRLLNTVVKVKAFGAAGDAPLTLV